MLKNILKLNGIQTLSKNEQKPITGGHIDFRKFFLICGRAGGVTNSNTNPNSCAQGGGNYLGNGLCIFCR